MLTHTVPAFLIVIVRSSRKEECVEGRGRRREADGAELAALSVHPAEEKAISGGWGRPCAPSASPRASLLVPASLAEATRQISAKNGTLIYK